MPGSIDVMRTMIEVAGLNVRDVANPNGDVEIKFIGLRDSEAELDELRQLLALGDAKGLQQRVMRFASPPELLAALPAGDGARSAVSLQEVKKSGVRPAG